MFCTNGVLLRMLTSGDGLEGVTHIVVDEIHERDKFADFLLIMLRDLLPSKPHLHLVLMSATLNVALFTDYFHGCPLIQVPGYTYPVQVSRLLTHAITGHTITGHNNRASPGIVILSYLPTCIASLHDRSTLAGNNLSFLLLLLHLLPLQSQQCGRWYCLPQVYDLHTASVKGQLLEMEIAWHRVPGCQ